MTLRIWAVSTRRTEVDIASTRRLFCRSAAVLGRPRRIASLSNSTQPTTLPFGSVRRGRPRTAALRQKSVRVCSRGTSVRSRSVQRPSLLKQTIGQRSKTEARSTDTNTNNSSSDPTRSLLYYFHQGAKALRSVHPYSPTDLHQSNRQDCRVIPP